MFFLDLWPSLVSTIAGLQPPIGARRGGGFSFRFRTVLRPCERDEGKVKTLAFDSPVRCASKPNRGAPQGGVPHQAIKCDSPSDGIKHALGLQNPMCHARREEAQPCPPQSRSLSACRGQYARKVTIRVPEMVSALKNIWIGFMFEVKLPCEGQGHPRALIFKIPP